MGELRHEAHIFSSGFTKKSDIIKKATTVIVIVSVLLFTFFQYDPYLDPKDRPTVGIASMAVVLSVSIAVVNWYLKNKQLQTQSIFKVFELLSSHDIRESRKIVHEKYCEMKSEPKKIFRGTKEESDADKVLSAFDQISAIVLNGLLDKDLVFDVYAEMIVRDWKTLKDEIDLRKDENPKTLRHFTMLKNDFEEMLKKNPDYKDLDTEPYCKLVKS